MNMVKAHKLLDRIHRNYELAMKAMDRAVALRGKTTRALAERDKAQRYIHKAYNADADLCEYINSGEGL
jgi:hypothetical protein